MMVEKKKILSTLVIITLIATVFFNVQTSTVVFKPFVLTGSADSSCANNESSWHNESWLNVTVESKRPRILWYDFQKCTDSNFDGGWTSDIDAANWVSKRNNMTETDNDTWYRFVINISSDQGWDNIEFINISLWHDNGNDTNTSGELDSTTGYNNTNNRGGNRNVFMYYDNTSNTTSYFNLTYPSNNTEVTIGNFSERVVSDTLGIDGKTETHNISFCFKPGFQFRYAPGPGETKINGGDGEWINDSVTNINGLPVGDGYDPTTCCWESFDNNWSWNFNITVENYGENWSGAQDGDEIDRYESWVLDEFGIYSYTEIVSADNAIVYGAPGENHSTNGSSWYNDNFESGQSQNVTVRTRSNGNYSMTVNISDLYHVASIDHPSSGGSGVDPSGWTDPFALQINNSRIYVRGGNRSTAVNFTNTDSNCIWLYGFGPRAAGSTATDWQEHERNGTCKYTGEANISDDGPWDKSEQFPNGYDWSTFDSPNDNSTTIEYRIWIPDSQIAGEYGNNVFYHLTTQTHD